MQKKNLKIKSSNKAITLIALVLTVIILIILAGVSISILFGDNGVVTKAKEAGKKYKISAIKERIQLEIANAETDAILRGEKLEVAQLEDIINKYGKLQEDGDTIITKEDEYELSLKEIWYGVLSESGSYTDKVTQIEMLEKELKDLQERYKELEDLNSGNSQVLEELNKQIGALTSEKEALENSLREEQEKSENLQKALEEAEAKLPALQENYNNLETEYKNFKKTIATAITNQGVATAENATAETMATNIATLATNKYNAGYTAGSNNLTKTLLTSFSCSWGSPSFSYNASGISGYQNLTVNNFMVDVTYIECSNAGDGAKSASATVTKSYNASTGIFTASGLGGRNSERWTTFGSSGNLYLIK